MYIYSPDLVMKKTPLLTLFLFLLGQVCILRGQSVFYSPDSITCDGKVFAVYTAGGSYDSLVWDWGNGARSTGVQVWQQYTQPGSYTIILYRYTGTAYDSIVKPSYIQYSPSGMPLPACIPGSGTYCCNYGIVQFGLNGFTHNSRNGAEGFRDFSCLNLPDLAEGSTVNLTLGSAASLPQDYRIWIDLNNNGSLEHPAELWFSADNTLNVNTQLSVPVAQAQNTPLLMLLSADFAGSQPMPCSTPQFGQAELYRVRITPAPDKPIASFFSPQENQVSCNGHIAFTNTSQNNPTYFIWDFGDGNGSVQQQAWHAYQQSGTYTVSLIAGNSAGADTMVRTSYIHVALSNVCDTMLMPVSGSRVETYYCNGVVMDNGKKGNYSNNTNGTMILAPSFAKNIRLSFTEFSFETGFDFLYIYDGPNNSYPLIGKFSGSNLPLGGIIQSSGPALTLIQRTDDVYTLPGFTALMLCEMGTEEALLPEIPLLLYPNPAQGDVYIQSELSVERAEIYSMQGQLVWQQNYPQGILHSGTLAPGLYQVRLYTNSGVRLHKLIRN